MLLTSICLLLLPSCSNAHSQDRDVRIRVRISDGEIEGLLIRAENGAAGYGFMGIPYARPPLGWLRFRNPVPPAPWDAVLPCKKYKSNCWQIHTTMANENFTGVEDCLYLNVFSGLDCSSANPCPVLYYIHGGGWEYDTPSVFPPDLLVDNFASHGLIVVTIAYRLNVFGFWSSGGDEAMGNYGIYDMIAGLKWVQREIHNFGGDPEKVTIMGHSTGGASVSLLSVSPKTRGLFHQGVMMSGNAVDDSVLQNDLTLYRRVASAVGCVDDIKQLWRDWADDRKRQNVAHCMRMVDMDQLGTTYLELKGAFGRTAPRNDGPDGIFPLPLSKLIADRRPLTALTGTTKNELGYTMAVFANATASTVAGLCRNLIQLLGLRKEKAAILECQRRYVLPYSQYDESGENSSYSFWTQQCVRIVSTLSFYSDCYKEASSLRRKGAGVYLYSFDYEKTGQEDVGPYHAFDLTFLIGVHPFPFDERDKQIQRIYAPLFANFVKYGDPTPNASGDQRWTPLETPFGFNYYSVDLPQPVLKPDYHKEDIVFWNYLLPLIGDGRSPHHAEKALHRMAAASDPDHGDGTEALAKWQAAFWVALAVLVATVSATLALFVRLSFSRVRNRSVQGTESQSLISDADRNGDDYQTFRA